MRIPVPVQYSAPIRHLLAVSLQRNLPGSQPHAIWFIWGYSDYSMDPLITLLYYLTNCEVILHGFLIVFCQAHRWMSLCIIFYPNDAWSLVIPLDRHLIVLCNLVCMLLCREVLTRWLHTSFEVLDWNQERKCVISFLYSVKKCVFLYYAFDFSGSVISTQLFKIWLIVLWQIVLMLPAINFCNTYLVY